MLGFRFPAYAEGIEVAGWHLHFISEDRQTRRPRARLSRRDGAHPARPVRRASRRAAAGDRPHRSRRRGEYPRRHRSGGALRLEIGAPGFEPGTSATQRQRATRLRHAPIRASLGCRPPWQRYFHFRQSTTTSTRSAPSPTSSPRRTTSSTTPSAPSSRALALQRRSSSTCRASPAAATHTSTPQSSWRSGSSDGILVRDDDPQIWALEQDYTAPDGCTAHSPRIPRPRQAGALRRGDPAPRAHSARAEGGPAAAHPRDPPQPLPDLRPPPGRRLAAPRAGAGGRAVGRGHRPGGDHPSRLADRRPGRARGGRRRARGRRAADRRRPPPLRDLARLPARGRRRRAGRLRPDGAGLARGPRPHRLPHPPPDLRASPTTPPGRRRSATGLREIFEVEEVPTGRSSTPAAARASASSATSTPTSNGPSACGCATPPASTRPSADRSDSYRSLDAAILEELVLKGILGMSTDDIAAKRGIGYTPSIDEALAKLDSGDYQAAFLLAPDPGGAGPGRGRRGGDDAAEVDLLLPEAPHRDRLQPPELTAAPNGHAIQPPLPVGYRRSRGQDLHAQGRRRHDLALVRRPRTEDRRPHRGLRLDRRGQLGARHGPRPVQGRRPGRSARDHPLAPARTCSSPAPSWRPRRRRPTGYRTKSAGSPTGWSLRSRPTSIAT